jgi:hypothetical protein
MQARFLSGLAVCLTALPAFVVAQQVPSPPKVPTVPAASAPVVTTAVPAPATPVTAPIVPAPAAVAVVPAPLEPPPASPVPAVPTLPAAVTAPYTGGPLAPLPKVEIDLPTGMVAPPPKAAVTTPPAPLLPSRPVTPAPPAKLTPAQIAQQIAPNFNVTRDYVRLTQCYGVADFMGAVTRIQASRPGATPQIVGVARTIASLQAAMQPMVLAASTVRTEARFRADYDAIARRGQAELASSRTPNVTMQRRLASLDACRADVVRWRGGR